MPDLYLSLRTSASKLLKTLHTAEPARVAGYHRLGGLIDDYLQENTINQPMDTLLKQLGNDLSISDRLLYDIIRFRRSYPAVPKAKLSWKQYVELLKIGDEDLRQELLTTAEKKQWSLRQLSFQIKHRMEQDAANMSVGAAGEPPDLGVKALPALRGLLYTYRLRQSDRLENQLEIDLGFSLGIELSDSRIIRRGASHAPDTFQSGDIVQTKAVGDKYQLLPLAASEPLRRAQYYSYPAMVLEVVDGDTLKVKIDFGFAIHQTHKLRLRGINTPEINTQEGIAAKNYVAEQLKEANMRVAITTTKEDKYGRYLADVFYLDKPASAQEIMDKGQFLNRELVSLGLAVRY